MDLGMLSGNRRKKKKKKKIVKKRAEKRAFRTALIRTSRLEKGQYILRPTTSTHHPEFAELFQSGVQKRSFPTQVFLRGSIISSFVRIRRYPLLISVRVLVLENDFIVFVTREPKIGNCQNQITTAVYSPFGDLFRFVITRN